MCKREEHYVCAVPDTRAQFTPDKLFFLFSPYTVAQFRGNHIFSAVSLCILKKKVSIRDLLAGLISFSCGSLSFFFQRRACGNPVSHENSRWHAYGYVLVSLLKNTNLATDARRDRNFLIEIDRLVNISPALIYCVGPMQLISSASVRYLGGKIALLKLCARA